MVRDVVRAIEDARSAPRPRRRERAGRHLAAPAAQEALAPLPLTRRSFYH
jgi:hypothetical protein